MPRNRSYKHLPIRLVKRSKPPCAINKSHTNRYQTFSKIDNSLLFLLACRLFWTLTCFRSRYTFSFCQSLYFDRKSNYFYKAGRQQEINLRFICLPRLFNCNFNNKIMSKIKAKQTKKQKKKKKLSWRYRCNQAGIKKDILTGK